MADRYQDRPFPADSDYDRGAQRAPQKGEGDPLAELARLIGQTDPFANFGRDTPANPPPRANARETYRPTAPAPEEDTELSPAPSWMNRARDDAARQPPPSPIHPAKRYAAAPPSAEPDYLDSPPFADEQQQPDPSRYDDQLYGQIDPSLGPAGEQAYADESYAYQDGYDDGNDGAGLKPRRGGMMTVVVVLALAVVGTGAAFGYRTYMGSARNGEPPVIKADAGPTKMIPPSASGDGMGKPIQDRLAAGNGTEAMVSREEQPVDGAKAGTRVVLPPMNQNANSAARPPAMAPSNGTLAGDEPRKIRTFSVKPDQGGDPAAAPLKPNARTAPPPPAAAAAATRTPPAPVANANASTANAPMSLTPQATEAPRAAARVASTTPAPAAPPTATSSAGGGYVVQVSSQRSEADAQASYRSLQGKFPSVLGSHPPLIKRADLGEKGIYYRAMVGPFGSPDEASQLCGSLKSAGGQCVVQRN